MTRKLARLLLVAVAIVAIVAGIALNGPLCVYGPPQPKYVPCEVRFPLGWAIGAGVAVSAIILSRRAR